MLDRARAVGPLERLHWFKTSPSFRDLAPADLAVLAQYANERSFRRDKPLALAEEPARAIHLLVEGRVRVMSQWHDTTAQPGDAIGLLEVLARVDHGFHAVAEGEALSLELGAETLLDILEDHFSILHHVLQRVSCEHIAAWRAQPERGEIAARSHEPPTSAPPRSDRELDFVERLLVLRRALPFARGSIAALADLARRMQDVRLRPGEVLWRQGDDSDHLLVLVRGALGCAIGPDGADAGEPASGPRRFTMKPGAMPGAVDALAREKRWYGAVAAGSVHALRLDAEDLLDLFEDNFEMAMAYSSAMARSTLEARPRA